MGMRVADRWFEMRRVDDSITHLWEPFVDPFIRCNIWHLRGRDADLLVDSGLGIASLRDAARELFDRRVLAVATHAHYDHMGGMHEFAERIVHRAEAGEIADPLWFRGLSASKLGSDILAAIRDSGYDLPEELLTALPAADYDPARYRVRPAPPTRMVDEGDRVDLGDRTFEILHLPGHSPGSIGLWEAETGTLFAGDAIYDSGLVDGFPHSNVEDYVRTMRRLRDLPVRIVHAGHEPSFGRERLVALADDYLKSRGCVAAGAKARRLS